MKAFPDLWFKPNLTKADFDAFMVASAKAPAKEKQILVCKEVAEAWNKALRELDNSQS